MSEFVAALLMVAAEERLKAHQQRCMIQEDEHFWQHFWRYRQNIKLQASEHESRAETYEKFARELTGLPVTDPDPQLTREVVSRIIVDRFERMSFEFPPPERVPFSFWWYWSRPFIIAPDFWPLISGI